VQEQLRGGVGGGQLPQVADGLVQFAVGVNLPQALAARPEPLLLLDGPEEQRHLRIMDGALSGRPGSKVPLPRPIPRGTGRGGAGIGNTTVNRLFSGAIGTGEVAWLRDVRCSTSGREGRLVRDAVGSEQVAMSTPEQTHLPGRPPAVAGDELQLGSGGE